MPVIFPVMTRGFIGPGLAGILALGLYSATLAPTVTSEDSGELITAAAYWGVPHPPGFPLWVILSGILSWPFDPAWGVNWTSAVYAAATVGLVAAWVQAQTGGVTLLTQVAGVTAGLLLATSQTFWSQAIIAEVYSLNTLLLLAVWLALLRWQASRRPRDLTLAAFFFGLGLANHHPLTLLTLPAILVYWAMVAPQTFHPRHWPPLLGALVPGLALYAYLPWAARREPPINWGTPSDWPQLWAHVSRSSYRSLELTEAVTWQDKLGFIQNLGDLLAQQWGLWPAFLGLAGFGFYHLPRPQKVLLGGVAVTNTLGLIAILKFRFEPEHLMRVNEYYLPAYAAMALAMGVALVQLGRRWRWVGLSGILWVLLPLFRNYLPNQQRHNWLADDFNRQTLLALEPDAIFYPSGDYSSFPSLYLLAVQRLRPDILLADYTGHPSPEALKLAQRQDPQVVNGDAGAIQAALLATGRPLYVAAKSDLKLAGVGTTPWGLVYRVLAPGQKVGDGPRPQPLDPARRAPHLAPLERSMLADHALMTAEALVRAGQLDQAYAKFREAEKWSEESKEGLNNLGSTLAENGFKWDAERIYRRAAALSGRYLTPRRNLALLLDGQGRYPEATAAFGAWVEAEPNPDALARWEALKNTQPTTETRQRVEEFETLSRAEPNNAAVWNNLGSAYAELRHAERAISAYHRALALQPDYALARKNLSQVLRALIGDIYWPTALENGASLGEVRPSETQNLRE